MTEREKVGGVIDRTMGMFLQDKRNPIYKNIKSEIVDQIASIVIESLGKVENEYKGGCEDSCSCEAFGSNQRLADIKAKWGVK